MYRKYIYVKAKDDYGGLKEGEVTRLRSKIPPHLEDHVTEVSEKTYDNYIKGIKEEEAVMEAELQVIAQSEEEGAGGIKTAQARKGSGGNKK